MVERKLINTETSGNSSVCVEGRSAHHIILPEPDGSKLIVGTCKHCGFSRGYPASTFDINPWISDPELRRNPHGLTVLGENHKILPTEVHRKSGFFDYDGNGEDVDC
jgi:hypothetical protein